jgi:hypothetical protein
MITCSRRPPQSPGSAGGRGAGTGRGLSQPPGPPIIPAERHALASMSTRYPGRTLTCNPGHFARRRSPGRWRSCYWFPRLAPTGRPQQLPNLTRPRRTAPQPGLSRSPRPAAKGGAIVGTKANGGTGCPASRGWFGTASGGRPTLRNQSRHRPAARPHHRPVARGTHGNRATGDRCVMIAGAIGSTPIHVARPDCSSWGPFRPWAACARCLAGAASGSRKPVSGRAVPP